MEVIVNHRGTFSLWLVTIPSSVIIILISPSISSPTMFFSVLPFSIIDISIDVFHDSHPMVKSILKAPFVNIFCFISIDSLAIEKSAFPFSFIECSSIVFHFAISMFLSISPLPSIFTILCNLKSFSAFDTFMKFPLIDCLVRFQELFFLFFVEIFHFSCETLKQIISIPLLLFLFLFVGINLFLF